MTIRVSYVRWFLMPTAALILVCAILGGLFYAFASGALVNTLDAAAEPLRRVFGAGEPAPLPPKLKAAAALPQLAAPRPAAAPEPVPAAVSAPALFETPPLPLPIAAQTVAVAVPQRQSAPQREIERRVPGTVLDSQVTLPQEWQRVPRAERRAVQRALARLGFDPGTIDGSIGKVTRNAIRSYERSQGLPETGELTPELVTRLVPRPAAQ